MKTQNEIESRIQMYGQAITRDAQPEAYYKEIEASIEELNFILDKTESEIETRIQMYERWTTLYGFTKEYPIIEVKMRELKWVLGRK